jgi:hypothetical protein
MSALRQQLVRLDRVCAAMNGWLIAIAIGLMILDFTVLVVKCAEAIPMPAPVVATEHNEHAAAPPSAPPHQQPG